MIKVKGSYTANIASIITSITAHLFLLAALLLSNGKPSQLKEKPQQAPAIKSFLYHAPKKQVRTPPLEIKKVLNPMAIKNGPEQKTTKQLTSKTDKSKKVTPQSTREQRANKLQSNRAAPVVKKPDNSKNTGNRAFTSFGSLARLKQQLSEQHSEQVSRERFKKRSISIMDGSPVPVPKSYIPISKEHKRQLNTTVTHAGSITKNDNGTCTINRQQVPGSSVPATTAYFECGESKFDKNFRLHMKKFEVKGKR